MELGLAVPISFEILPARASQAALTSLAADTTSLGRRKGLGLRRRDTIESRLTPGRTPVALADRPLLKGLDCCMMAAEGAEVGGSCEVRFASDEKLGPRSRDLAGVAAGPNFCSRILCRSSGL